MAHEPLARVRLNRRSFLEAAGASALVVMLEGRGQPAEPPAKAAAQPAKAEASGKEALIAGARREGTVTLYTSFQADMVAPLSREFEKDYPFVKVKALWLRTALLASRVEAEYSVRDTFDVVVGAWEKYFVDFAERKILAAYRSPEAAAYDPKRLGAGDRWLDIWAGPTLYGYNKRLTSEAAIPHTWRELTDAKYKGKGGITTPVTRGGSYWWFYAMHKLYGVKYFDDLAANDHKIYNGLSAVAGGIANGEVAFGVTTDSALFDVIAKGAPVGAYYPDDGVYLQPRSIALAERAPHPNAARLFYDWMASERGGKVALTAVSLYSLHPKVPAPQGRKPLNQMKAIPVDLKDFVAREDEITNLAAKALKVQ